MWWAKAGATRKSCMDTEMKAYSHPQHDDKDEDFAGSKGLGP